VVVGAPSYFERHGTPQKPEDLLRHECITFRAQSTGALCAWELERGRKTWRVLVRGGVVANDFEPEAKEQLRTGRLKVVLEAYTPTVPGFFLHFPSRAQRSRPLRLFIEAAKELALRAL
jgi:DNA-binding transcriptional LysR family regulator